MKKIGLIGAGLMGHPMAKRWLSSGFNLTVFEKKNRKSSFETKGRIKELIKSGAGFTTDFKILCDSIDCLILILPSSKEIESILLNPENLRILKSSKVRLVIDMSTSAPTSTVKIGKKIQSKQLDFIDAPVTGGVTGAENGTLTLFLGGKKSAIKKAESFLRPVSEKRFYFGPLGQGHAAKIINNFICIGNLAVFSEALVLGAASGLDPQTLYDTLLTGTAQSRMLEIYGKQILKNDFQPRFKLALAHKDIGLARDLNRSIKGEVLTVLGAIEKQFVKAEASGLGAENLSALIKPIERSFNKRFRS